MVSGHLIWHYTEAIYLTSSHHIDATVSHTIKTNTAGKEQLDILKEKTEKITFIQFCYSL